MANATVVRDWHTADLLNWAVGCCLNALTVLRYMPVPKPAGGKEVVLPPELQEMGILRYEWRNLHSYVHVAITHACVAIDDAVAWPHDEVDNALLDARGKIKYAADRIAKAEMFPDKLAVDECVGALRPGLTELRDAFARIEVKNKSGAVIAPNGPNTITSVPVSFCVLAAEPGQWFDRQMNELKKQQEEEAKAAAAKKAQGGTRDPAAEQKAAEEAKRKAEEDKKKAEEAKKKAEEEKKRAEEARKKASGLNDVEWEEAELEEQEAKEEEAQEAAAKKKRREEPDEPSWWEVDPSQSGPPEHELFLRGLRASPVKGGHFLLFRGSAEKPEAPRTGHTDDAGRLFWDDTKQPAFLPPGQTYWYFWSYDAKQFQEAVAALTGPGAGSGGFCVERKYGLMQLVTSISRLEARLGSAAESTVASELASQLFPKDGKSDHELGGAEGPQARLRRRATWVFSGLLKGAHGYHPIATGLEDMRAPSNPDNCWFVAQRPGIAVIHAVELLQLYIQDAKLRTAKDRATIQQLIELVEVSEDAARHAKRIHAFDLPAMRVLKNVGMNRQFGGEQEWIGEKRSTLEVRAENREHFGKLVEYVRASALATSKDGRWVDIDLMEHALASDSETIYTHCDAARERIRKEFEGPEFPGWRKHFNDWAYRDQLLNYFALYQYHRRITEPNARETKNHDQWYENWKLSAAELERQAGLLDKRVKELMETFGRTPGVWADIAWHERVEPGDQTRAGEVNFDQPRARHHFRYVFASAKAKYPWWESFPSAETPEFEAQKVGLGKIAKATFDSLGRADEVLKKALEVFHKPFAERAVGSLTEACLKAEGINTLISGEWVSSGLEKALVRARRKPGAKNILELEVWNQGDLRPIGSTEFTFESIKLAKDEAGRAKLIAEVEKKEVPLAKTKAVEKLAEHHLEYLKRVPTFFNGVFQVAIAAFGIKEFIDSNRGEKATFQLAGEIGYAAGSIAEILEVVEVHRLKLLGKGLGRFTKPYTAMFAAVGMIQVFAEGAICYFGEAPAADWRGDKVRAIALRTKGAVLMFGSAVAIGMTIYEIGQAGLTAAAFGPGGWVICAVVLIGLAIDGIAGLFGEARTFLTELEEKGYKALEKELKNGSKLDGFHRSRSNTYLWRACQVAWTLLDNKPRLLPATAYLPQLEPAASSAA